MPSLGRMCYLTTVKGPFHGRVVAARLGSEGVVAILRGVSEGLGPLQSAVDVLVPADQLQLAREILLADAVDDVFDSLDLFESLELEDSMTAESTEAGVAARGGTPPRTEVVPDYDEWDATEPSPRRRRTARTVLIVALVVWLVVVGCLAVVL